MKTTTIRKLIEDFEEEATGLEQQQYELEQAIRAAGDQEPLSRDEFDVVDLVISFFTDNLRRTLTARSMERAVRAMLARHQEYLDKWAGGVPEDIPRKALIDLALNWQKRLMKKVQDAVEQ
jgi:hypothetical protein